MLLSREEAVALHHALVCARFERFVAAALEALEMVPPTESDGAQVADDLYAAFWRADAGASYRLDLDLAERLGAAWATGHTVEGQQVRDLLLGSATLCDAADALLRFAHTRYCMRAVLVETITAGDDAEGRDQMVQLLKNTSMGVDEAHIDALLWFLGRREYHWRGRQWARRADSTHPRSLQLICELVRGSPERMAKLAEKVLTHSVVWREPLRCFLDVHWRRYLDTSGRRDDSHLTREERRLILMGRVPLPPPVIVPEWKTWLFDPCNSDDLTRLDQQLRLLCTLLLPVAIETCHCWERPSEVLLRVLQHVAAGGDGDGTIRSSMCKILQLRFYVPRQHPCRTCEEYRKPHRIFFSSSDVGWKGLIARAEPSIQQKEVTDATSVPTLCALSRDVLRQQLMGSRSISFQDVLAPVVPPIRQVWYGSRRWTYEQYLADTNFPDRPHDNQYVFRWRTCGAEPLGALHSAFEARRGVDLALNQQLMAWPCPHQPMCSGCHVGGHAQELRECPDVAMAHLLSTITPYLATERPPTPPIPPHIEPGEEDGVFEHEDWNLRRRRHLHERKWSAYAWP